MCAISVSHGRLGFVKHHFYYIAKESLMAESVNGKSEGLGFHLF